MHYGNLNLTNFRGLKLDLAFAAFSHTDWNSNSSLDKCVDPLPPEVHIRIGCSHEHSMEQLVPKSAIWHSSYVIHTRLKNIKNVKGCRDGMPKSMQTR